MNKIILNSKDNLTGDVMPISFIIAGVCFLFYSFNFNLYKSRVSFLYPIAFLFILLGYFVGDFIYLNFSINLFHLLSSLILLVINFDINKCIINFMYLIVVTLVYIMVIKSYDKFLLFYSYEFFYLFIIAIALFVVNDFKRLLFITISASLVFTFIDLYLLTFV